MLDVILDSLFDGIKAFFIIFSLYIVLSFFYEKISSKLSKSEKLSPFYGALFGLVPQCGVSVITSELYLKKSITIGTLIAVFLACSDEAIPIILSSGNSKALMAIPLILVKFVIGFIVGVLVDLIVRRSNKNSNILKSYDSIEYRGCSCGCCNQEEEISGFDKHIWFPFVHSLKLLGWIIVINIIFATFIYLIGKENLVHFLESNKYVSPVFATLVGLIPNCASSIVIAELFINGTLSFAATLSGLCVNAGLGLVFIFKDKNNIKSNLLIVFTLIVVSLLVGYLTCLIVGF